MQYLSPQAVACNPSPNNWARRAASNAVPRQAQSPPSEPTSPDRALNGFASRVISTDTVTNGARRLELSEPMFSAALHRHAKRNPSGPGQGRANCAGAVAVLPPGPRHSRDSWNQASSIPVADAGGRGGTGLAECWRTFGTHLLGHQSSCRGRPAGPRHLRFPPGCHLRRVWMGVVPPPARISPARVSGGAGRRLGANASRRAMGGAQAGWHSVGRFGGFPATAQLAAGGSTGIRYRGGPSSHRRRRPVSGCDVLANLGRDLRRTQSRLG